ncbi:YHYH domain-containing protein [Herminiimonas fonticola]
MLLAFGSASAFAHSGGTDSSGCHHDRKNGGYHCH